MQSNSFIIFLLVNCILLACNQSPNPKELVKKTNISIPKKFRIFDYQSNWNVGETDVDYTLLISKEDYQNISKEIEEKIFFQRLDTSKYPILAFTNKTDLRKMNETACLYDDKYFYQIFRPDPGVIVTIVLEKDSIMMINYNDL